ncbi:MAG: hypothetical protein WBA71_05310 [Candidatus Humimicrobiia bacterium]
MDKKAILASEVKNLNRRVFTISEKYPDLLVNPTTKNMYLAYVKQMKTLFPENEEVQNLSEEIEQPFDYVDLSNLMGHLVALLNFLLKR